MQMQTDICEFEDSLGYTMRCYEERDRETETETENKANSRLWQTLQDKCPSFFSR